MCWSKQNKNSFSCFENSSFPQEKSTKKNACAILERKTGELLTSTDYSTKVFIFNKERFSVKYLYFSIQPFRDFFYLPFFSKYQFVATEMKIKLICLIDEWQRMTLQPQGKFSNKKRWNEFRFLLTSKYCQKCKYF